MGPILVVLTLRFLVDVLRKTIQDEALFAISRKLNALGFNFVDMNFEFIAWNGLFVVKFVLGVMQPVIFLHGGPGAGTSGSNRRFFDPAHYRIILLDQVWGYKLPKSAGKIGTPLFVVLNPERELVVSNDQVFLKN